MASGDHDYLDYPIGPSDGPVQVIRLSNFSLADHLQKLAEEAEKNNPFIPPIGCPIAKLPNELLSQIFTIGAEADDEDEEEEADMMNMFEDDESDSGDDDEPEHEFQVLVSHVCRRWRDVALQTPTLWTTLDFSDGPPFHKSRTWIERSKECPLDIDLDCTDVAPRKKQRLPDGRITPDDLPAVRDLIMPHLARWRTFEFMANDFTVVHNLMLTLAGAGEATHLEALQLYHYEDTEQYETFAPPALKAPLVPFGGRAPALVHLALWGIHVDWEACHFLEGLKVLELAYHAMDVRPSYENLVRILHRSPELETLTLCLSGPGGEPKEWPKDVVEIPSVTTLVLAFHDCDYISDLMQRFSFPNLKSLALDFDAEDYSTFINQLAGPSPGQTQSFLGGLISLKISGLQCNLDALNKFYSALSNLTALSLNCYHLDEVFFTNLFPPEHGSAPKSRDVRTGVWLPRLDTLTTSGIDGSQMHELVLARRDHPIKRVNMDMDDDVDERDEAWLRSALEHFDFFEGSEDEDDDENEVVEFDDDDADDHSF
ncbi:hypothetical protein BV25DRAFT_1805158 [Artomyces pyxidatus]|uniref:Uncharacterized protein n=1 Tax=Artomyces pyxidatus TaxID=48021 RepID=A0ACB8T0T7_9AGAM|nr:hypothetical protein BV25DRAFT_1805158 [Artomyces pyxidatus]